MKKIYREFFYIPKHAKVSDKVFRTRTILSALTMLICCAVFCSGTFAWFNSNRSSSVSPITAAKYSLSIVIDENDIGTSSYQSTVSYTCPLATGDQHTVTLTHNGTAENGYCVINAGGNTYSTVQIEKGGNITLTIQAAQGEEITFTANWGEYQSGATTYSVSDGDNYLVYGNGDCIEISSTPYQIYTVVEGATLELIAEHYGVSASDILLYNGIEELIVGEEIKIPNTEVTEPLVIASTNYVLYTVAEGVTLEMLAEYYGVSAEDILTFNSITELTVGEEIKIPNTVVTEPFVLNQESSVKDIVGVATPSDAEKSTVEESTPSEAENSTTGVATPSDAEKTERENATDSGEETSASETESSTPKETEENTEPTTQSETETGSTETTPIETPVSEETEDTLVVASETESNDETTASDEAATTETN